MKKLQLFSILILIVFISCEGTFVPKPRGYMRTDFPEKKYKEINFEDKFNMQISEFAFMDSTKQDSGWFYIHYPKLKATIYLTYFGSANIAESIEQSRELVYKHSKKADDIIENDYFNDSLRVYASLYEINGNTASSVNFHLIDSTSKYLRGSLYFYAKPNKDSLAPSIRYIKEDISYLIEHFEWN